MADRVAYDSLFSNSRANVVALITTTNVPDTTVSSSEYRKRIYARYPDVKANDFAGYPFIIVHPADPDPEAGGSLNGKSKFINWDIDVEIVTSDRGWGGKDGQGMADMDAISDALVKTFNNVTNRVTLGNNSMHFSTATTTSVTSAVESNQLVFKRSIMLSFRGKIQVST